MTPFNGRVVLENDLSQVYLSIDHCCPRPVWAVVLILHRWQEEHQSTSSTAGRAVPFSVLAVQLFSTAHIFARFESFEMKFFHAWYQAALFRKTK